MDASDRENRSGAREYGRGMYFANMSAATCTAGGEGTDGYATNIKVGYRANTTYEIGIL